MTLLTTTLASFWRFCIPPIAEREAYTLYTLPLLLLALLPILLAAHIRLRHPGMPFLVRLTMLIVSLPVMSHFIVKRYVMILWTGVDGVAYSLNDINFVLGMANGFCMLKVIEYLFLASDEDYQVKDAEEQRHKGENGNSRNSRLDCSLSKPRRFPGSSLPMEVDMVLSVRGHGYRWGPRDSKAGYAALHASKQLSKQPASVARQEKWSHIRRVGLVSLMSWAIVDVCDSIVKDTAVFPPATQAGGGRVAAAALGSLGRVGPLVVTLVVGVIVVVGLQGISSLIYTINLLITPPSKTPITVSRWEPLPFRRPHLATSLGDFWAKEWHAYIRRLFVVFAYKPVLRLSSRLGLPSFAGQSIGLLATFALSGLMHEGCVGGQTAQYYDKAAQAQGHTYLADLSMDDDVLKLYGYGAQHFLTTYAFTIQAVFIIVEGAWTANIEPLLAPYLRSHRPVSKKVTNIVDGPLRSVLGWLWTMSCMMHSGYYLTDLWLTHGLGNSAVSFRLTGTLFRLFNPQRSSM